MTVISSTAAVLACGATKLGHREQHDIVHPRTEVDRECGDRLTKRPQKIRELSLRSALVRVRVPANIISGVGERDLETDAGLYQLRDLHQRSAELCIRIDRAILR